MGARLGVLFARYHSAVYTAGLVAAIVLFVVGLFRHGFLSPDSLKANKDAIAASGSIVTMVALLVGGIASYYRFFRGRTFSVRAFLTIEIDVIGAPDGDFLHALTFRVKNVGSAPIWNPQPDIRIEKRTGRSVTRSQVVDWVGELSSDGIERAGVIDAGETGNYFVTAMIPADVWAVTYLVLVSADTGDVWSASRTIANRAASAKPGD